MAGSAEGMDVAEFARVVFAAGGGENRWPSQITFGSLWKADLGFRSVD